MINLCFDKAFEDLNKNKRLRTIKNLYLQFEIKKKRTNPMEYLDFELQ
jgi:hypothetical protein